MTIRIGIPRALLFFEYSTLWISFFNRLGAEVIVSKKSNKNLMTTGTKYTVDDACVPVKIYHGHVLDLHDQVDFIFVPRIVGVQKGDYICPKFCGLPEMIKYSIPNMPKIINTKIDLTKSKNNLYEAVLEIGHDICADDNKIIEAYEMASNEYKAYKSELQKGVLPSEVGVNKTKVNYKNKIMVMGHPYLLYDDYLNMNIINKLRENEFEVITPEMIDQNELNTYALQYEGKIFWSFSRKLLGSCFYLIDKKLASGMIYLSSFGCGIDSIVAETVERRIRKEAKLPFMLITIDEHSGEAGFNTRLEAFIDMLKWRNQDENYLPPHGEYVYTH